MAAVQIDLSPAFWHDQPAMRIAAIEVSHWHSLYDAAYLRILSAMPDVHLVGLHDPNAAVAAKRAKELGEPPVFTDYRDMLTKTKPDFVVALGQHSRMAETALYLLDQGYPFMMEKPMGVNAGEVSRIADKAALTQAFVAVAFPQRYSPFVTRARQLLAEGRFGPLSHLYFRLNRPTSARYTAWDSSWMLDPNLAGDKLVPLALHVRQRPADDSGEGDILLNIAVSLIHVSAGSHQNVSVDVQAGRAGILAGRHERFRQRPERLGHGVGVIFRVILFTADVGVHGAADSQAAVEAGEAYVTAQAAGDLINPALFPLARGALVGDELAAHGDGIRPAVAQHFLGKVGVMLAGDN